MATSLYVIAAMCGNFYAESTMSPGIWEGLKSFSTWEWDGTDSTPGPGHGFGLGQWTNSSTGSGGRLAGLHTWMSANGYAMDSMTGQIAYIRQEATWHVRPQYSNITSFDDFINSTSTDLDTLTKDWFYCWEGPDDDTLATRQGYAKRAYDYIAAHADDASITSVITDNRFLSLAERDNNAVMFYRIWGGEIPTPTPTVKMRKIPVWMMILNRRLKYNGR